MELCDPKGREAASEFEMSRTHEEGAGDKEPLRGALPGQSSPPVRLTGSRQDALSNDSTRGGPVEKALV